MKSILFKTMIIGIILISLSSITYGITITTEPNELSFENVLNNGYAEKTIKIMSDSSEPLQLTLSAVDPIKEWLSFEPSSALVSADSPAEIKIIVEPVNAELGIYQGYIIINTVSTGNKLTTSIATAIDLKTTVEITDQQIMQAVINDMVIKNTELNAPIKASVTVQNQGNIAITPFFQIDILDANKEETLKSSISDKKTILPSSTDVIELDIENELGLGQYWAKATLFLEDNWILGQRFIKFNIIEKGTLPIEEEPTIKVYPTAIPLSTSWIIIVMWILILVFIGWKIKTNKPNKKK